MFSFFKNNANVSGAISAVYTALETLDVEVTRETTALNVVNDKIVTETTTHATAVTALTEEFNRKLDAENTRFTSVKTTLDAEATERQETITKGSDFANALRAALAKSE